MFGPDVIKESEENVKLIQDRLEVAQSRQKSYADSKKRKEVVHEIGYRACLRVSPLRGVKRFGGPYRVLERMREVAHKLELPKDCQELMMCFTFPR